MKINILLRGNVWFYSFTASGKRYRGTTGIKERCPQGPWLDRAKALAVAEREYRGKLAGTSPLRPETATAGELLDAYIARKSVDGRAPSTIRLMELYQTNFNEFFGPNVIFAALGDTELNAWKKWLMKDKGYSKSYTRKHLTMLASVCHYWGLPSPLSRVEVPKEDNAEVQGKLKYYDRQQLQTLLDCAKAQNREAWHWLSLLAYTGMRKGEALGISDKDIVWEEGRVYVVSSKMRDGRWISLPPASYTETESGETIEHRNLVQSPLWHLGEIRKLAVAHYGSSMDATKPYWHKSSNLLYKWMQSIAEKAGVPVLCLHSLRHSFVTLAIAGGYPLASIAKHCGHRAIATTYGIYGHLSKDIAVSINLG